MKRGQRGCVLADICHIHGRSPVFDIIPGREYMHMEVRFTCLVAGLGLVAGLYWIQNRNEPVSVVDHDVIVVATDAIGNAMWYTNEAPSTRAWNFVSARKLAHYRFLYYGDREFNEASVIPLAERVPIPASFDVQPTPKHDPAPATFRERVANIFPPR